jgi:hypothetical protein
MELDCPGQLACEMLHITSLLIARLIRITRTDVQFVRSLSQESSYNSTKKLHAIQPIGGFEQFSKWEASRNSSEDQEVHCRNQVAPIEIQI